MTEQTSTPRAGARVRITPPPYETSVVAVMGTSWIAAGTPVHPALCIGPAYGGQIEIVGEQRPAPSTDLRDQIAAVLAPYQVHDVVLDDVLYRVELAMYPISHDLAAVREELDRRDAENAELAAELARLRAENDRLLRFAAGVRTALDQPRVSLMDGRGRRWDPVSDTDDLWWTPTDPMPCTRAEIERDTGAVTEVPAERGEAT